MPKAAQWQVVVGGIGTVYEGVSEDEARTAFRVYRELSRGGVGRAGREMVVAYRDGEVWEVWEGKEQEE